MQLYNAVILNVYETERSYSLYGNLTVLVSAVV